MEATPEFLEKAKSNYRSRKMKNCIEVISNDERQKNIINLEHVVMIKKMPNGRAKFVLSNGMDVFSLADYEEVSKLINAEVIGGDR